jgi:hypothetical protein
MNFTPISRPPPSRPGDTNQPTKIAPSTDGQTPTEASPNERHYSALARMVAEVSQDHAHLRTFIYEFARIKLRKELYPRFVDGAWTEIEEQMRGLEAAIEQIEADFAQDAPSLPFAPLLRLSDLTTDQPAPESAVRRFGPPGTTRFGEDGIQVRSLLGRSPAYGASSLPAVSVGGDRSENAFLGKHLRSRFWRRSQLITAVAIGVAIYAASDLGAILNKAGLRWSDELHRTAATTAGAREPRVTAAEDPTQPQVDEPRRQRVGDTSIPTEYGAYAVVDGRLIELEQLPIKVPDPRVAISAAISIPSGTRLPASPRQFVIFRRDLMNSAPDRAAVRIVAQVVRALSFDTTGHPKSSSVERSWVIRNNSYPMRVGPLGDNPEMIALRPESADFVLPAGRYALVLKGVGYDFTVDGPVTDPVHCLERTEALNAPIYSECPKP